MEKLLESVKKEEPVEHAQEFISSQIYRQATLTMGKKGKDRKKDRKHDQKRSRK